MSSTTIPRLPGRTARPAMGGRLRSVVRGREGDPAWVRPTLLALFALAALLCLWNLTENGYSNEYYAAAAKAGSESWKAWFFGALDPGSFITVDKPPLSLWLSGLSARVLGFSSFSILLPQALCTIAAVGVLYATVRRLFGTPAGLIAGLALALTPVTVAIGRVNNPDALLVLLMVSAAWFTVRAVESGRTKHLAWAGAFVGLAFMTKLLQGWMVVPALALVYLIAGPPRLLTRVRQLLVAGVTMVVVSAAWPVAVTLWPGSKPYIGGSTNGSIWNLIFGYDGFGRILGSSGGNTQSGISFGGAAGLLRMFNTEVGGQVAWLIPVAAVGLVAGLWLTRGERRTDLRRAGLILFGVWALVHIAVFSSQQGIFHPYYVSALAPAIAALVGAGAVLIAGWARRCWAGIVAAAVAIAAGAWMAEVLLDRDPSFSPWLRVVIAVAAVAAIALLMLWRIGHDGRGALPARGLLTAAAVASAIAVLAGPASYAVATLSRSISGNNVMAGPASATSMGGFGGGSGSGGPGGARATSAGGPGGSTAPRSGGFSGPPSASGTSSPAGGPPSASGTASRRGTAPSGGFPGGASRTAGGGAMGGGTLSAATIRYLEQHQGSAKYLLAATGSQTTAPIIIQTGRAVVTIGGFNGGDPAPTLSQFVAMVHSGELKYVLVSGSGGSGGSGGFGGAGGPGGGSGTGSAITQWVKVHGTKVTAVSTGSGTLYSVS